jgi:hypothetical protein
MESYDVGDGYIHIQETIECRYEVAFENKLLPADIITGLEHGTLSILIVRQLRDLPDDVTVFDQITGATYTMTVPDRTTGYICVPWLLLG